MSSSTSPGVSDSTFVVPCDRNKKSVISIKIIAMATLIHKIYNIYNV